MGRRLKRQQREKKQQERSQRRSSARAAAQSASTPPRSAASPWHVLPEAERRAIERADGFAALRNGLRRLAAERGDWSGLPIPIEGLPLVVEPTYPYAAISQIGRENEPEDGPPVRAVFRSTAKRCDIAILEREDGKVVCAPIPGSANAGTMLLDTLNAADAWGIEQEANAVNLLGTLLRHRAFKAYLMTGTFLETSRRSGITYLFRRLRPTVAISSRGGNLRIIATLCMHPIGYYSGSWAGAMCPTDDVIAHLMLMRGDEPLFWRRCNQHAAHRPEAGL